MSLKNLLKNQSEKCFFDSSVTNCAKGIAILLMLYHHLFYKNMDYGQFIYSTALLAKAWRNACGRTRPNFAVLRKLSVRSRRAPQT